MKSDEVYPVEMTKKAAYLSSVAYVEQVTGRKMLSDSGEFQYTSEDVRLMLAFYQEMLNKRSQSLRGISIGTISKSA